ncbi:MAG TPA: CoA pyrophosphatase [Roseiarcus sp.]|nr:CoA pyrophosphatase [Roseiarcus sp.]
MNVAPTFFSVEDFRARALKRLSLDLPPGALDRDSAPTHGDYKLNAAAPDADTIAAAQPAAVLLSVVDRPGGATVLLTQRASALRRHSGQIAFPGGKIDPGEAPMEAALREAREEIGLQARDIEPVGWLDPYLTGTGFRILPMAAIVAANFKPAVNPSEVEEAFETPLSFLMNVANHQRHSREWQGRVRHFYAMPYENRYIWGATAGILRNLYERLYS